MQIIGICGSSGSGKSTVCQKLSDMGFATFDCDQIYHELISKASPCTTALTDAFGIEILADSGIDRRKLANIVFQNPEKLQELNRISHHYVTLALRDKIRNAEDNGAEACIIDAPMLFESGLNQICDLVCGIVADRDVQIRRIRKRDGITEEAVLNRLNNQIPSEDLKQLCDIIFENNEETDKIDDFCEMLYQRIISLNKGEK